MKKDQLKSGISAMFGDVPTKQPDSREITEDEYKDLAEKQSQRRYFLAGRRRKDSQRELVTKDDTRTSLVLDKNQYAIVREIALREGMTIKDLVYAMFQLGIDRYEDKHGKVYIRQAKEEKDLF